MVELKHREILLIFVFLVIVTSIVFGLGIFLGQGARDMGPKSKDPLVSAPLEAKEVSSMVETMPSKNVSESKSTEQPLTGYTIQINILETNEEALLEKERLQKLGFPSVFIRESTVEDRTWFTVDLGYFKERDQALRLASQLQSRGSISSYMIRKSNFSSPQESRN